jgi:predicted dehydrogenase
MSNHKVRVAIVGTGNVASGHAQAYKLNAELIEVAALADIAPGKAEAFAAQHGLTDATICSHYEEALALPDVEAVDICTRWPEHAPASLAAFEAGKHVFCEKPMAGSAAEATKMAEAAKASGLVHLMDFTYRYYPGARFIKQLVDGGRLGEIVRVRTEYLTGSLWSSEGRRSRRQRYRTDPDRPADNIIGSFASHMIDLARSYGGEITRVWGRHQVVAERGQTANAIVDFATGAVGTIEASATASGRLQHYRRAEVHGTKGAAVYCYTYPDVVEIYFTEGVSAHVPGGFVTVPVPGAAAVDLHVGWVQGIAGAQETFARAIRSGTKPDGDFYDGYRSQVIMEAIARSSRTGQAVDVIPED